MPLADARIRALKPRPAGHYEVPDGRGLVLRIHASGRRTWMLRATDGRTGEQVRRALGEYPAMGLSEARAKADEWRQSLRRGIDPTKPPGEMTVRSALDGWLRDANLRSEAQIRRRFELHVLPRIGKRLLAELQLKDIARLLRELRHDKGLTAEVNRVRSSLSALFAWGKSQGEIVHNPVLDTERVSEPSDQREKAGQTRILTLDELVAIWRAAEGDVSPLFSALVRLLILVPLRRQEWTELAWNEIEAGEQWFLRLPAGRMKGKRPHAVPLPVAAVEILRSLPNRGAYAFSFDGQRPFAGWRGGTARLRKAAGLPEPWTVHDVRRGVATAMGEAGVRETVIRRLLAHSPRGFLGTTAVYEKSERLDELRHALESWARVLEVRLSGGADILALRRAGGRQESWRDGGCDTAPPGGSP
jgi:integrase